VLLKETLLKEPLLGPVCAFAHRLFGVDAAKYFP
jgi:hypothetical protein